METLKTRCEKIEDYFEDMENNGIIISPLLAKSVAGERGLIKAAFLSRVYPIYLSLLGIIFLYHLTQFNYKILYMLGGDISLISENIVEIVGFTITSIMLLVLSLQLKAARKERMETLWSRLNEEFSEISVRMGDKDLEELKSSRGKDFCRLYHSYLEHLREILRVEGKKSESYEVLGRRYVTSLKIYNEVNCSEVIEKIFHPHGDHTKRDYQKAQQEIDTYYQKGEEEGDLKKILDKILFN